MRFIDRLSNYSDEAILNELVRLANQLGKQTLTIADLEEARVCYDTLENRFGGLRPALEKAGLQSPRFNRNVADDEMLLELKRIWDIVLEKEGRRPYKDDLKKYNAKYSHHPYYRRWGSWIKACEALLEWEEKQTQNMSEEFSNQSKAIDDRQPARPKRDISLRLRYEVLKRDNFRCVACGRSPATHPGLKLHVDHVQAASKGGLTEFENLRTLCSECNIGKSNW